MPRETRKIGVPTAGLRIGAVSYLNTKPLVWGLAERLPHARLSFDLPSRLADDLSQGQLDIALIPAVETFQRPDYAIVSNACIACRGPVWSVKLFSRVAPEQIRTLAVDEGSRTSAALVRILLGERWQVFPRTLPLPIQIDPASVEADALLLIGDRAIHEPHGVWHTVWDLGQEWQEWTHLPFVFAMWTARPGLSSACLHDLEQSLQAARDDGVRNLPEIAAQAAPPMGLSVAECLSYLRDNLHFYRGPREQQGLALFHDLAARLESPSQFLPPRESLVT